VAKPRKPISVELPIAAAKEIEEVARRTRRSVAFVVRRALGASGAAGVATPLEGPQAPLVLTTDDDDPADLMARIDRALEGQPLARALSSAWESVRTRFLAWAEREEHADTATDAGDLDRALADAVAPATSAERLASLASSEYPRVRALVAVHPHTPAAVLAQLAQDREPSVRKAATEGRS
jgi:hypothetical protein